MKKYNLSEIMKRAWEMVKDFGVTMSEALTKSWAIAKDSMRQKTVRVKLWKAAQIDADAKRYNTFCDVVYNNGYYKQDDDTVIYIVRELIRETAKAVYVHLGSGHADGSYKGWKTWIPKSAITECNL